MDVGEEDGQLAAGPQQLGQFYSGDEVSAVWPASSRPVVDNFSQHTSLAKIQEPIGSQPNP